jgi:hypothetical protein
MSKMGRRRVVLAGGLLAAPMIGRAQGPCPNKQIAS